MYPQVFHGDWRGREVAIKVMAQAGASRAVVDEFRREVSTMSALPDHPNVLRLLGACVQAPLALVTPYCQKCAAPDMNRDKSVSINLYTPAVGPLQRGGQG